MTGSLEKYGAVVVENAFSTKAVDQFVNCSKPLFSNSKINNFGNFINYADGVVPLISDEFILAEIITKTLDDLCKNLNSHSVELALVRELPQVHLTSPSVQNPTAWVGGWHVDFPTEFKAHVILDNLDFHDTRMQVVPCSNLLPLVPSKVYDLDALPNASQLKMLNCYGPKGTLYIHRGITLHRNFPVLGSERFLWCSTCTIDRKFPPLDEKMLQDFIRGADKFYKKLGAADQKRLHRFFHPKQNEIVGKSELSYV